MERAESLVFDRAVDYYDKTRSLSSASMNKLVPLIRRSAGDGPCLEIGVGTGRIALPLQAGGTDMVGLDLSVAMMRRLVHNAGGELPFPLVAADAASLPLVDDSFAAALAVHVLHLIPAWRRALEELGRVVRPSGALVIDIGRQTQGPFRDLLAEFASAAKIPETHRGVKDTVELDAAMAEIGATLTRTDALEEVRTATYARTIEALEAGTYSITWAADQATREEAATHTRRWAEARYGPLDRRYDYKLEITLRTYRLPQSRF
jgi:ubiquinone/menaquinone biosynthesis C-methylase UbiE